MKIEGFRWLAKRITRPSKNGVLVMLHPSHVPLVLEILRAEPFHRLHGSERANMLREIIHRLERAHFSVLKDEGIL